MSMISGQDTWPSARFCRLGAISVSTRPMVMETKPMSCLKNRVRTASASRPTRSEEHTSELQSQSNLVCRLLLEKKKKINGSDIEDHDCSCAQHRVDNYPIR